MRSKLLIVVMLLAVVFSSCKNTGNGELIGVSSGNSYTPVDPYGMAYIPMGSFTRGVGDQDISGSNFYQPKTITVSAFYMDETEITNNEYRQFVYWVRDSLAYRLLGEQIDAYLISEDQYGEPIDPPFINWEEPINWYGEEDTWQRWPMKKVNASTPIYWLPRLLHRSGRLPQQSKCGMICAITTSRYWLFWRQRSTLLSGNI